MSKQILGVLAPTAVLGLSLGLTLPLPARGQEPAPEPAAAATSWVLSGDWEGDGADTPARVDLATWRLATRSEPVLGAAANESFATLDWIPVAGDWDGDGLDTVQMFSPETWRLVPLEQGPLPGQEEDQVEDPEPDPWLPVAGDWDGDGRDTVLVVDAWSRRVYRPGDARPAAAVDPERAPWFPLAVDPDGDGRDTLDRFSFPPGPTEPLFPPGPSRIAVLSGDWDGDRRTTRAVIDAESGRLTELAEYPPGPTAPAWKALDTPAAANGANGCYDKWNLILVKEVVFEQDGFCQVFTLKLFWKWHCCPLSPSQPAYGCSVTKEMEVTYDSGPC
jgi:hypothetical protein